MFVEKTVDLEVWLPGTMVGFDWFTNRKGMSNNHLLYIFVLFSPYSILYFIDVCAHIQTRTQTHKITH